MDLSSTRILITTILRKNSTCCTEISTIQNHIESALEKITLASLKFSFFFHTVGRPYIFSFDVGTQNQTFTHYNYSFSGYTNFLR